MLSHRRYSGLLALTILLSPLQGWSLRLMCRGSVVGSFNQEWVVKFDKCLFCNYFDDHVLYFYFCFVNMLYHTDRFVYVKTFSFIQGEVLFGCSVCTKFFNVLLKSIDWYFIKDFYIYDYRGYRSVILFSFSVFPCLWYLVTLT